ncbi:MAG: protein-L-isoaspartate O-methyltransferase [Porphyrobacter sp.]|nr:protein-L-isoaspartate O-methyltransferase [Porphyrobacter sp.]
MTEQTMTREPSSDTRPARRAMIDSQLRTSGVNEEYVLARMLAVPREDFLPAEKAPLAYIDRAVMLGTDGHIAAPLFYGKLLMEAAPRREDRVLVVEGGTGYLAELLRPLVGEVVTVSAADAAAGKATGGEYTLVAIDGAVERVPDGLAALMAEDGRIVSGVVLRQVTRLAAGRKVAGSVTLRPVEDLGIPVLHAFDAPKGWTFA